MENHKIIIIGAGPAGIGAAVQLAHFGYNPLLIEKDEIGGLLRNARSIQNFPGIPYGISGIEFIKILKDHLDKKNIRVIKNQIHKIDFNNHFILLANNESFTAARL